MTHTHQSTDVKDTDLHLKIDPISRIITNESGKTILMQGDHNSERFTFAMPRYVDGHDMSLCDIVEIHYNNVGQPKSNTNSGIYEVDDLSVGADNEEIVTFSWLVSSNATKYPGSLDFVAHFACSNGDEIEYSWDTEIYSGVDVRATIHNSIKVVDAYADVLERWKELLFNANDSGLSNIDLALKNALLQLKEVGDDILNEMTIKGDAVTAKSWAVGGTGSREGEDTNNSWYWALEAAKEAIKAQEAAESIGNSEVKDTHNISGGGVNSMMILQNFLDVVGVWLTEKVVTHENFPEDLAKKLKNDGTTTEEGFALDARYGKTLTDSIQKIHSVVRVSLLASKWEGESAPFTQTVAVEGVSAKDEPIMVSLLADTATTETQKSYNKAYGLVASGIGTTGDGSVTFKVFKKPAIDIEVGLTHLRGDI